jgi:ectoine hydroxylase
MSANDTARSVLAGSMTDASIPDFTAGVRPAASSRSIVPSRRLTDAEITRFRSDGFLLRKDFFAVEEIQPLIDGVNIADIEPADPASFDKRGQPQEVATWMRLGNDLCGVFPRVARMVEAAEAVLGLPVYHWHSKLATKHPGSSGSWDWQQDYGYWYGEGTLYPDFVTVAVALDRVTSDNGCLRMVRGSHRCGRIDVKKFGEARSTDPERLNWIFERHETVDCAMAPGDMVMFHSNTLHASGPNTGNRSHTLIHCTYNTVDNAPLGAALESRMIQPMVKLPDDVLVKREYDGIFKHLRFVRLGNDQSTGNPGYRLPKRAPGSIGGRFGRPR